MLSRTKTDDFRVMPYNLRIIGALGIWEDRRRIYRLYVLLLLTVVTIVIPKPIRPSRRYPFEAIVRSVAEHIFAAFCYVTILTMGSKTEPFRQVIRKIEQALAQFKDRDDQCSRLIVDVNSNIHRFSVAFARLHLGFILLFNVVPPAYNIPHYFRQQSVPVENRTLELLFPLTQDFYGLDIHQNIVHYSLAMVFITPACIFGTFILWSKSLLFILIRYNTLVYQLVNRLLRQYDAETRGAQVRQKQRKLQRIVELHCSAIECTGLLDSVLRLILLVQFVGCLLLMCMMLFYITRNPNLSICNVGVLLLSIFIEMMCFSYLGSQLTEENATISHSAFECRWYDEPIVVQKYFLQIIMQTHRKATITAGKFHSVDVVTFTQLIRTTYTYYMIMKEMF